MSQTVNSDLAPKDNVSFSDFGKEFRFISPAAKTAVSPMLKEKR